MWRCLILIEALRRAHVVAFDFLFYVVLIISVYFGHAGGGVQFQASRQQPHREAGFLNYNLRVTKKMNNFWRVHCFPLSVKRST